MKKALLAMAMMTAVTAPAFAGQYETHTTYYSTNGAQFGYDEANPEMLNRGYPLDADSRVIGAPIQSDIVTIAPANGATYTSRTTTIHSNGAPMPLITAPAPATRTVTTTRSVSPTVTTRSTTTLQPIDPIIVTTPVVGTVVHSDPIPRDHSNSPNMDSSR